MTPPIASVPHSAERGPLTTSMRSIAVGWNVLQRRHADRAGIDAHAVDHDERVVAFGAADEHRRRLAGTAVATELEPGMEPQQLRDIVGTAALDGFAVDHDRRRNHFVERRLDSRGRDYDRVPGSTAAAPARLTVASDASASAQTARPQQRVRAANRGTNVLSEKYATLKAHPVQGPQRP